MFGEGVGVFKGRVFSSGGRRRERIGGKVGEWQGGVTEEGDERGNPTEGGTAEGRTIGIQEKFVEES